MGCGASSPGVYSSPGRASSKVADGPESGPLPIHKLIVTVHRGIELAAMDSNGKSDPYVRLELLDWQGRQLAGSGVRKSKVVKRELNPHWDQEITFGGECAVCDAASVRLTVLDKDFRADEVIGECEVPIEPGAHREKRRRPPGHGSMRVVSENHDDVELVEEQQFPLLRDGKLNDHYKHHKGFGSIVVSAVLRPPEMSMEELHAELARAAKAGDAVAIEQLAEAGAGPDAKDGDWPAVVCAASRGHTAAVEALVRLGADLSATNKWGGTALMRAAYQGHPACVAALLQGGAAVDLVNEEGWSALTCAARWGNVECARLLLDAGADTKLQATGESVWEGEKTALEVAEDGGYAECAAMLEAHLSAAGTG